VKPLSELEHWFQGEIVRPHEARATPQAERERAAALVVKPSNRLTPAERVEIYSDMYFARLLDVLGEEYQTVRALAGHADFARLVRAYLREHPSRHWSLAGLGRKLPAFLAGSFRMPKKALLTDVARLECLMAIVFDAPTSSVLTPADAARVPPEAFNAARLVCIPALELASFDHPANAIVRALRHDEKPKSLAKQRTFTVVWRKDWVVWRMDLTEPMFHVLAALKAGRTLGAAIAEGGAHHRGDEAALQADIGRSFGEWIGEGLFERVESR
jgi:hypothetical protein